MTTCPVRADPEHADPAGRIALTREAGGLARVVLHHPGRMNALTVAMWQALARTFEALSADTTVRSVLVRGADGHFAAGADIREFPVHRADPASAHRYHIEVIAPALQAIQACPHPVVAAIEGVCVGGGLEIASVCDLRVAATSARFGVPINRLGFPMAPDEMRGLLALAGRAVALEILFEGRIFGAQEAQGKGLLNRVVPDEEFESQVQATLDRILRGAPLAARANKALASRLLAAAPMSADEVRAFFDYAASRDHREGVRAFLAGEEPVFTGE